ncbi:class I SAM-dependent methyltransferase [Inquilinus limosus]|uniref:SAM-dependent methyltransferase n=1 Tax=Inquilinus limosus TaxID=171674 RepID=A0A211ZK58_9PROT|nr:class I SAM-dependent methyltransferase [Inquilinus limosus]OWJ65640.1 SAM-dependent methyltransferase [Inquilinus limosus]
MLHDLGRVVGAIARDRLDEAAVYRRERLYARPRAPAGPPGVLECPICGTRARRFLRFGLEGRRNAMCPGCGSVERHRFLWLYLTARTDLLTGRHRVLHAAPEPWLEARLRGLPNLRYRSLDRFNPFADVQADLTALPFADGTFDVVIANHVLEHIPDDAAAIAELARVLRPGGRAVLMVPFDPKGPTQEGAGIADPAERMRRFGHPYHYRINGRDFPDRLAAAGLAPMAVDSRALLRPHLRRRFRVNRNHLFDCRRR